MIEIFFEKRKKGKRKETREREREKSYTLNRSIRKFAPKFVSCIARALEGNGSNARRSRVHTSTAKKQKRWKEKGKRYERTIDFLQNQIFFSTRSTGFESRRKFLEAKGLQQAIVRVSYRTITRNTRHARGCERARLTAKRPSGIYERRRRDEKANEGKRKIYIHTYVYIYVYIHTKARNHGLGKLQDRVPTGINQGRKEEEEERWEEAIRIPRTHGHAFNQSSSPIFDICNL